MRTLEEVKFHLFSNQISYDDLTVAYYEALVELETLEKRLQHSVEMTPCNCPRCTGIPDYYADEEGE